MTIKEFMEQQGAQSAVADRMGVTRQNVNLWVNGKLKVSVPSAIKVSKVLAELGVQATPAEVIMYFNERREAREKEMSED